VQISENVQDMTTFLHILGQGKPLSAGYKAISVRILMKMQKKATSHLKVLLPVSLFAKSETEDEG